MTINLQDIASIVTIIAMGFCIASFIMLLYKSRKGDKKYNKENERNKQNPADEQKVSKLEREIKKLKTQIAKLSDEFYGNYTDNEYYT